MFFLWLLFKCDVYSERSTLINSQTIPNTRFSNQITGSRWILFQLVTKLCHVDAEIVGLGDVAWSPNLVQQLVACDHFARVLNQHQQQLVFNRREVNFFIFDEDLPMRKIDP